MKKSYLFLLVAFSTLFFNSCKSDRIGPDPDPGSDPDPKKYTETVIPKEAYRMQLVEATFSTPLSEEEYSGTLGETAIQLVRADEHTLVFYVPATVAAGTTDFSVPQLNVLNSLEIKDPQLNGSAEEVLQPVFEKTTPGYQEIADGEYATYLNTVNQKLADYYETLSAAEKTEMALFYQVNESLFAEILNPETGMQVAVADGKSKMALANQANQLIFPKMGNPVLQAKSVEHTVLIASKFTIATYLFVTCSTALTFPGTPIEKAVIAAVAITGAIKAWDFGKQLVSSVSIVTGISNTLFNGNFRTKAVSTAGLTFVNDAAQNIPLYTEERSMTTAERSSSAEVLTSFFSAFDDLTAATKTVNNIISFINDHVFFADIPAIPLYEVPASAETQGTPLTEEVFGFLNFSIEDNNVKITETSFENGAVRIKMNVINPDAVTGDAINTQLNYTYTGDFNDVSGSMPIEVKLEEEEEVPSVNEIQFSLNIDGWTFESTNFTTDGIHKRQSSCDITNYNAGVIDGDRVRQLITITGELYAFMNSPIGTIYQFGGYTAPGSGLSYTCKKNSTYIDIKINLPDDYPNCNGGLIESLVEQGTFTKTGTYSFSFSGTVVTCGRDGYKTGQISGSGTLVP